MIAAVRCGCGCFAHNGFLTRAGYMALDNGMEFAYLDSIGSVSALDEDEDTFAQLPPIEEKTPEVPQ